MSELQRVLIVGAGIAGLCTAKGLADAGIDVEVVDINRRPIGIGIIFQGNTLMALEALGLVDTLIPRGFGMTRVFARDAQGEIVRSMDLAPVLGPGRPGTLGIRRTILSDTLADAAAQAGATVRNGVTVERLDQNADGVDVIFTDGRTGRYDLVVGADGLGSTIRRTVFDPAIVPTYAGENVVRVLFPRPDWLEGITMFEGDTRVGLVPLSEDTMYLFATQVGPQMIYEGDQLLAKLREAVAGCHAPQIRTLMMRDIAPDEVYFRPFEVAFLEGSWFRGRVMLLGDAAHAMTAHLASGAGMAIEDAAFLCDLARAGTPLADLEPRFMERRYARVRRMYEISLEQCQLSQVAGTEARRMKLGREGQALIAQHY